MITMSIQLRAALILGAVITMMAMLRQIRKRKMRIDSSIFWVLFSFFFFLIAVFPDLVYIASSLLGIISPANLVLAGIILILIVKMFLMTLEMSEMKEKLAELARSIALREEREACMSRNRPDHAEEEDGTES